MCLLLQCGNAFVLDCNTVWICMLHVILYTHYKLGQGGGWGIFWICYLVFKKIKIIFREVTE